jgi:hypothetical protein
MHFSVFTKMKKSCKNGQIFTKFHEILVCKNILFSRKCLQKSRIICAKIFAKTKNSAFGENIVKFWRKQKTQIFVKILRHFRENFRGNKKRGKCSQKSRNIFAKTKTQTFTKIFAKMSVILKILFLKSKKCSLAEPELEPHHLVRARAVMRCDSGSDNGIKHG